MQRSSLTSCILDTLGEPPFMVICTRHLTDFLGTDEPLMSPEYAIEYDMGKLVNKIL